jgi:hypothetical protein
MEHLEELMGDCPFKLYDKTEAKNFDFTIEPISIEQEMPPGIGITKEMTLSEPKGPEQVLVDPLTHEIISREPEYDKKGNVVMRNGEQVYEVHDKWFKLDVKFVWEEVSDANETGENADGTEQRPGQYD